MIAQDTKEKTIEYARAQHLETAEMIYDRLGDCRSMWIQLFNWVDAEDIYSELWDSYIQRKTK